MSSMFKAAKNIMFEARSAMGVTDEKQIASLMALPHAEVDLALLEKTLEHACEKRKKHESSGDKDALAKRCVPVDDLEAANKRRDDIVAQRAGAVTHLKEMLEAVKSQKQDSKALEDAIASAKTAGVPHKTYQAGAGESGAELVASTDAWLQTLLQSRSNANAVLQATLIKAPAELDCNHVAARGIDAARKVGGIDASLVAKCETKLAEVLEARRSAVRMLREATRPTMVAQELAPLAEAIQNAKLSGVGQSAYMIEGAEIGDRAEIESGPLFLSRHEAWLEKVSTSRSSAQQVLDLFVDAEAPAVDTEKLRTAGIQLATEAGGISTELIRKAEAKLQHVVAWRAKAVDALKSAIKPLTNREMASQNTDALEAALAEAEAAGVAQEAYAIEGATLGSAYVRSARDWLVEVTEARKSADAELLKALQCEDTDFDHLRLLTGGIVMAQMVGQKSDELISLCKERLDRVLDRRKLAVESARAVWKIGNAVDQDLSELRKALEEVKSSGVGQDSYVTESSAGYEGESGPKFVQALASWCSRLNDSRMSAYKALTSAAKYDEPADQDVDLLAAAIEEAKACGVDHPTFAIKKVAPSDPSAEVHYGSAQVVKASAWLLAVKKMRAEATEALCAVFQSEMIEQDLDLLGKAIGEARAVGVAHSTYKTDKQPPATDGIERTASFSTASFSSFFSNGTSTSHPKESGESGSKLVSAATRWASTVSELRQKTYKQLVAVWKNGSSHFARELSDSFTDQDIAALEAALAAALHAGVAHATYRVSVMGADGVYKEGAEMGSERVQAAEAWCETVKAARAEAMEELRGVWNASAQDQDVSALKAMLVKAIKCGVNHKTWVLGEEKGPGFVNAAQKWVEKVASNRSKAVNALEVSFKALVAQPSPTGAPVDALQNLLELAYKDGVGHESYVLESGESGAAFLEKIKEWLQITVGVKAFDEQTSIALCCFVPPDERHYILAFSPVEPYLILERETGTCRLGHPEALDGFIGGVGKRVRSFKIEGVVGLLTHPDDRSLVLITQASPRQLASEDGVINVLAVTKTVFLPLKSASAAAKDPFTPATTQGKQQRKSLGLFLEAGDIFLAGNLSTNLAGEVKDLTHTLQRRAASPSTADARFCWNATALEPIRAASLEGPWLTMIMHAAIVTEQVILGEALAQQVRLTISVISRRSVEYAGTRLKAIGLSDSAAAADFVESEQIMYLEATKSACASIVQTRGSPPIFWEKQATGFSSKAKLSRVVELAVPSLRAHMETHATLYGGPVLVLSLLEDKGDEGEIAQYLAKAVSLVADQQKDTRFFAFDLNAASKPTRAEGLSALVEQLEGMSTIAPDACPSTFGFFSRVRGGAAPSSIQKGVVRTNELDSGARTNAAQMQIGTQSISAQLGALCEQCGVVQDANLQATVQTAVRKVWAENGDTLSLQYTGSKMQLSIKDSSPEGDQLEKKKKTLAEKLSSLGSDVLDRGAKAANQLLNNEAVEETKQAAIDCLLGCGKSIRSPRTHLLGGALDPLQLFVGTFNSNGKNASAEDLTAWLQQPGVPSPPDMVVLGFQEFVSLNVKNVLVDNDKKRIECQGRLEAVIKQMYPGETYLEVCIEQMVGVLLLVYVRSHLAEHVRGIFAKAIACGFGSDAIGVHAGNKGAIALRMDIGGACLCIINAHLPAGQKDFSERNATHHEVLTGLAKEYKAARGGPFPSPREHDLCVWLGDLNYRIDLPNEEVRAMIESGDYTSILKADQLKNAQASLAAFERFEEAPITFQPTYKYDPGTQIYDTSEKARVPAWTDRVLWCVSGGSLSSLAYVCSQAVVISDHKPVASRLVWSPKPPATDESLGLSGKPMPTTAPTPPPAAPEAVESEEL